MRAPSKEKEHTLDINTSGLFCETPELHAELVCIVAMYCTHVVSVPFVNRPFESRIHGTVNFTQFCCFLLRTWCYRVLLSCYLRPK